MSISAYVYINGAIIGCQLKFSATFGLTAARRPAVFTANQQEREAEQAAFNFLRTAERVHTALSITDLHTEMSFDK